ncbi:MAG TPA: FimV/HubP family polar landmark protein [Azonexus sp.]|nr:FimV/HubP family polar landmark protein [Azonexus sp.]
MAAEPKRADDVAGRLVQPGETLRKIALETKYEGVSLEQMLVGIFQKNPDAFIGNNINRLKAGAILGLPEKSAVESVTDAEAKKVYVTQAGDWSAYRQRLAASTAKTPAREVVTSQSSSGKIVAKVEEKAAPAEQGKDQVKVSSTEMPVKGTAAGKAAASEADQLAKEKALKEAQDRLALLEKNVNELQKLVEMKNQKLAELQQQNAANKEEIKPAEPVKPAEPPKPVETPKLAESPKPAEAPVPVAAEKPVQPKPVDQPKKPEPSPVPLSEPSFLDSLLEDPLPLVGGGGILALLAGYFLVKRRRDQGASMETTAAPGPSSLGPNSVFRMTGGQSIDTGNTPPQTGDFSQTGPGTIDTDEVDPVAEADVYMAYGRDTQAEEILLEALQKDPQRTAIHAKLLEIYANRGSVKQFETLASELYAQTGGVGADWEKVAALGAGLDPSNPLYSAAQASKPVFDADATMIVSPQAVALATLAMPGALAKLADSASGPEVAPEPSNFDFDSLTLPGEVGDTPELEAPEPVVADAVDEVLSLDFDLGSPEPEVSVAPVPESSINTVVSGDVSDALDFDLGTETIVESSALADTQQPQGELSVTDGFSDIDIDFDLNIPEPLTQAEPFDATPDFSPEGTLVMPSAMDDAIATFVGFDNTPDLSSAEQAPAKELPSEANLDLDSASMQTIISNIAEPSLTDTLVQASPLSESLTFDNSKLADTIVNPGVLNDDSLEFDVKLTDSVFLGQPMMPPEFDIGSINLDLAAEPVLTEPVVAESPAPVAEAPVDAAHWEEVNTKLDLAKAYEEMGDLEGARELLDEVVGEGPVDLVEQARAILARIGE